MDFAYYTSVVRDFVAAYPNWAAAVVFALASSTRRSRI